MRALLPILIVSTLAIAAPKGAAAHARLDHANPKVGSTVTTAPKQVVLTFTEKLEPAFSSIEVRNGSGADAQSGKARAGADRTQLSVPLKALSPGTYTVIWKALSVDTHRTQGTFTFTVGR
jgi:methionine-rich copper-binding protein CopC